MPVRICGPCACLIIAGKEYNEKLRNKKEDFGMMLFRCYNINQINTKQFEFLDTGVYQKYGYIETA